MMKVLTSREFNQDVSAAKRAARLGPVVVTDRGRPTHVLVGIEAWKQLTQARETIVDLLALAEPDGDPAASPERASPWPGGR